MAMSNKKLISYSLLVSTIAYAGLYYFYAGPMENIGWKLTLLFPRQYAQQFGSIRYFPIYLLLCFIFAAQKLLFFILLPTRQARTGKEILSAVLTDGFMFYFLTPFIAIAFQSFIYSVDWAGYSGRLAAWADSPGTIFIINCLFIGAVYDLCFLPVNNGGERK